MPHLLNAGRETRAVTSVLAEHPAATRLWSSGIKAIGIKVPEGLPWTQPLKTAWLAGAVGGLKLVACSGYVLVSWLSSLKLSYL